jgi:hypothetical protein
MDGPPPGEADPNPNGNENEPRFIVLRPPHELPLSRPVEQHNVVRGNRLGGLCLRACTDWAGTPRAQADRGPQLQSGDDQPPT